MPDGYKDTATKMDIETRTNVSTNHGSVQNQRIYNNQCQYEYNLMKPVTLSLGSTEKTFPDDHHGPQRNILLKKPPACFLRHYDNSKDV
jgi:hypothetical protein